MVLQHGSNETNFTKQFKEMTQEKLVQNFNQFFCKKTWRIFLLWPFLYRRTDNESMAVFILQSHYLSVRTRVNILQFVWLCVTCIKMGTRRISIYTLSDLGDLSNLIGSLSRTIQQYSPPSEWIMCELGVFSLFLENHLLKVDKILALTFF